MVIKLLSVTVSTDNTDNTDNNSTANSAKLVRYKLSMVVYSKVLACLVTDTTQLHLTADLVAFKVLTAATNNHINNNNMVALTAECTAADSKSNRLVSLSSVNSKCEDKGELRFAFFYYPGC